MKSLIGLLSFLVLLTSCSPKWHEQKFYEKGGVFICDQDTIKVTEQLITEKGDTVTQIKEVIRTVPGKTEIKTKREIRFDYKRFRDSLKYERNRLRDSMNFELKKYKDSVRLLKAQLKQQGRSERVKSRQDTKISKAKTKQQEKTKRTHERNKGFSWKNVLAIWGLFFVLVVLTFLISKISKYVKPNTG